MTAAPEAAILGTGSYLPEQVLTNDHLASKVDTSDAWIFSRTGIRERRIAAADQATSDLGIIASRRALESAGITPGDVDLVICATTTADYIGFPSTACLIQKALGIGHVGCFDVAAACSGFLYGLTIARQFVKTGAARHVLVVGAEVMSRILDWTDRQTCVLFGDGAGAAIVGPAGDGTSTFLFTQLNADGEGEAALRIPAGGSRLPLTKDNIDDHVRYVHMNGREVFKFSVTTFEKSCRAAVQSIGKEMDDIDWIVPHQVNDRILKTISERLGFPLAKIYRNLDKYGNTSAASVPIALDEAVRGDVIRTGDTVLMIGFGAGYTWATAIIHW